VIFLDEEIKRTSRSNKKSHVTWTVRHIYDNVTISCRPFLRHRARNYRHFNLITGIDDNIAGNYVKIQADFLF